VNRRAGGARSWTSLAVAGSLLMGGAALAQSPATNPSPDATCTPLPVVLPPTPSPGATLASLTVFAAASLNKPFSIMGQAWAAQHPGSELTFSFDSSSALRAQIEEGAPVDVFASADLRNPQALVEDCLAPGPPIVFATNRLVIVVPMANPAGIDSPDELATPGVRIVAAGEDVPITKYSEQVLAKLAALADAPDGYIDAVNANIVSREDNVAAVLAKLELGEGDAGIVYTSDAANSEGVTPVLFPDEANVVAQFGAVSVADTDSSEGAAAFLDYLDGAEAQAILGQFGFLPPQ
jgi:molybdate transport system substrate-binding protein